MNNSQVAHIWAQNKNKSASGSNFYCEYGVIYSYGRHFPIALFLGNGTVLFTKGDYSITTRAHITYVRSALNWNTPRLYVPEVPLSITKHDMKEAYKGLKKEIETEQIGLARRRSNFESHLNHHNALIRNANALTKYFKLCFKAIPEIENMEEAARGNVKIIAAIKKAKEQDKRARAKRHKEQIERMRALRVEALKSIEMWKESSLYRLRYEHRNALEDTYLRLKSNNEAVETSQGAEFPVFHAKKAWEFIKFIVKSGEDWKRNGTMVRLGHYQVDSIEANGDVKAGCHFLKYAIMKEFAEKMGW